MRRLLLISTVLLLLAIKAYPQSCAGTTTCSVPANPTCANMTNALNSINTPNTVLTIPAGTSNLSSCANLKYSWSFSVTIQGASSIATTNAQGNPATFNDNTIFTSTTNQTMFDLSCTAANSVCRIMGITFTGGSDNGLIAMGINSSTGAGAIRMDHCHFLNPTNTSARIFGGGGINQGVIDHNLIDLPCPGSGGPCTTNFAQIMGDFGTSGNIAWNSTTQFGGNFSGLPYANAVYIENNTLNNGFLDDSNNGARVVMRFNTLNATNLQASIQTHGTGSVNTGHVWRGGRVFESYENVYTSTYVSGSPNTGSFAALQMFSGTGLSWGETVSGYSNFFFAHNIRDEVQTNYSQVAPPAGWGYCGTFQTGVTSAWDTNQNLNGSNGWHCLDQPGAGKSDLLQGEFPNVCNVTNGDCAGNHFTGNSTHQSLEAMYVMMPSYTTPSAGGTLMALSSPEANIQLNRDVYGPASGVQTSPTSPFNGTSGTGWGTLANRPTTCSANLDGNFPSVAYWATDQGTSWNQSGNGIKGQMYQCTALNTWTLFYTPYTYPHPLVGSTPTVANPSCAPTSGIPPQTVSCTDTTPSAKMCWRTDGGIPTASTAGTCDAPATTYSGTIAIGSNPTTLNIIGTLAGSTNSGLVTYLYSGPAVSLTPPTMTTFQTNQHTTSAAQVATLTNTGGANLIVSAVSITGVFAQAPGSSPCGTVPFTLAAGASCNFNITFNPATTGTFTGTFTITDNASGSPHTISLQGLATAPTAVWVPSSYTFPNVIVGSFANSTGITLQNTGNGPLSVNFSFGGVSPAVFALVNSVGCSNGSTLAAGGSCTITLSFTPPSAATFTATFIETDSVQSIALALPLTGTGLPLVITPPPAPVSPTEIGKSWYSQPRRAESYGL